MELKRLGRAIADRWAVVAIVALLGVLAALIFTTLANQNLEPRYEATATLRFEPIEGETIADLADDIRDAQDFATIAAEDQLRADPNSLIVESLADARLLFVAQGPSRESAGEKAEALIQSFLETDPTLGGAVGDRLTQLEAEATSIQAQIDELQPILTAEERDLLDLHMLLDAQIIAINDRLVTLVVEEAAAPPAERPDYATERANLQSTLAELKNQKQTLPPPPPVDPGVRQSLLLTTLRRRMELLTSEYERLFLRQLGVTGAATVEPTTFVDLTSEPGDPLVNSAIGLLGGLLIALLGLSFSARARGTVWLAEDINVPVLAEVPGRRISSNTAEAWYDHAEPGPRRTAIQALRASIEVQIPDRGATVAVTGYGVASEGVQALMADLGTSLASAGWNVLMIDANFESRSPLGEYKVGGASLSEALAINADLPDFASRIRTTVERAHTVRPGLSVVASGPPPRSGADALAGRQFRTLLNAANELFDVVMLVVDEFGSPGAQVVMQRTQQSLLVLTPGETTASDVNNLLLDAARIKITIMGAVFLGKLDHLRNILGRGRSREAPSPKPASAQASGPSPITRLEHYYPAPDERRSALVPHGTAADLASRIGQIEDAEKSEMGKLLVRAGAADSDESRYELVAANIVERIEDMVTARYGFGDFSDELIQEVKEAGFVSLRPLRDHKTAASLLRREIEMEVDRQTASQVMKEVERILLVGSGIDGLDDWLAREFFKRHLDTSEGEPVVWHLTSRAGHASVLVPAHRLDSDRIESLIEEVASAEIDEMERYRKAATMRGDHELAAAYDLRIEDVREFKSALSSLIFTESGRRRRKDSRHAWNPDWRQGTRVTMAPLQELGLLPFDVLAEDELSQQLAST